MSYAPHTSPNTCQVMSPIGLEFRVWSAGSGSLMGFLSNTVRPLHLPQHLAHKRRVSVNSITRLVSVNSITVSFQLTLFSYFTGPSVLEFLRSMCIVASRFSPSSLSDVVRPPHLPQYLGG